MFSNKRKTRNCTKSKFGGSPNPLANTEPPTNRQIIQDFYFLNTYPSYCFSVIVKLIAEKVIMIWKKVNTRLPLMSTYCVEKKVGVLLNISRLINRRKCKVLTEKNTSKKLDRLFDISSCTCDLKVVLCNDKNIKCSQDNCPNTHILCTYSPDKKFPVEERLYLKNQRDKSGPKGSFQLGSVDCERSRKGSLKKHKTEHKNMEQSLQQETFNLLPEIVLSESDSESVISSSSEIWEPARSPSGIYNLWKFPKFAIELIRNDIGSSIGAALGNALLLDLSGLFNDPAIISSLVLDKSKIDRQKKSVKVLSDLKSFENNREFVCLGVDGKIDNETLVIREIKREDGEVVLKRSTEKEHHMTVTKELLPNLYSGEYLTHKVLPLVGATGKKQAQCLYEVLEEYDSLNTLKAVLADNTSTNTGHKAGMVVELEKKLGRKLQTIGCNLHQNELPFRSLFKKINGVTNSPNHFAGPLGKMANINNELNLVVNFGVIKSPIIVLEKEILDDLSSDQRLLYEYCIAIATGNMSVKYSSWKIGPLNHSRWLTLAIGLMSLYVRVLVPDSKLIILVNYIVQVDVPTWFLHKKSNKLHEAPSVIYFMINQIKLQGKEVQDICLANLRFNTFCLLPENILYSMLKSEEIYIRSIAMQRLLDIRNRKKDGQVINRINKIPEINIDAHIWYKLINIFDEDIDEPATTQDITDEEIVEKLLSGEKIDLPGLPSHSQSVERSVQLVSMDSRTVFGKEARHKHILAKILSKKHRKSFKSKRYYGETYDDIFC
ncbi:uncharacterized protein LOC136076138 [Hydra vulgaris]|uniref:Uncharacterized protein LOC136076138 n=1 Tax=Hydra vulgaris TaxID=6087 RepID=A0ABM4B9W8_HYDVU